MPKANFAISYSRFFLLLLAIVLPMSAWAKPTVNDVRVAVNKPGVTRVVIESSQAITPKIFTLPAPSRVVIDIPESNFKPNVNRINLPQGVVVTKVRQGIFKPGTTRMVFEASTNVTTKWFQLPARSGEKHRLVIDLISSEQNQVIKSAPPKAEVVVTKPSITAAMAAKVSAPAKAKVKKSHRVVVIDAGHGGADPGAVGYGKTYEKNVVLAVAKRLKTDLERGGDIKVYLTRSKDIYVPLRERTKRAQSHDADVFISLHADAHRNRKIRGGSVYVLSEKSSDKEAERLARNANQGDLVAGIDLSHESKDVRDILIDLTQRETMNQSAVFGKKVLNHLEKTTTMRKKKIQFAGFMVLKAPEVPSILVELSYISNPQDEKNLNSPAMQTKMAGAIANGIRDFLSHDVHK